MNMIPQGFPLYAFIPGTAYTYLVVGWAPAVDERGHALRGECLQPVVVPMGAYPGFEATPVSEFSDKGVSFFPSFDEADAVRKVQGK
jgi:hypothetical protein